MSQAKHRRRSLVSLILLTIVFLFMLVVVFNRQRVVDTYVGYQYHPSEAVANIRTHLQLTSEGTFYFNASQPVLQPAKDFNASCDQHQETNSPVIGCYVGQRTYIYDVVNSELDGIEETTAAHELLHAVYERLGERQKVALNTLLEQAYQRIKTPELEARMNYYRESEPGEEMNELHSILGTEEPSLGEELEKHYAQYFKSRSAIVAYHDAYSKVFDATISEINELQEEINADVARINARIKAYNADVAKLESDTTDFNRRSQSGDFASVADFNTERAALVAKQATLNSEKKSIQSAITDTETKRAEYNKLVKRYNNLGRSINSSIAPTPSLGE